MSSGPTSGFKVYERMRHERYRPREGATLAKLVATFGERLYGSISSRAQSEEGPKRQPREATVDHPKVREYPLTFGPAPP